MTTHFFLGANSGGGYRSLFPELTEEAKEELVILKGGPGTEVPVFLERLGAALEAAGLDVEYLLGAEDPARPAGVSVPGSGWAAVDGRPPHPLEPDCPGPVQRVVDLGRFMDLTAARRDREEILRLAEERRAAERRAFRSLNAAEQLEVEIRAAAGLDTAKLDRRVAGILRRELRRKGGEEGRIFRRFLASPTGSGRVEWTRSAEALCPKVYQFADSFGLAGPALAQIAEAAAGRGWNVILCPSPAEPERPEQVLIPGLGLAFLTEENLAEKPWRRVRLDAMAEVRDRGGLRFRRKVAALLRQDAQSALREAEAARDALAALYDPYTDWDGVLALAATEAARALSRLEKA